MVIAYHHSISVPSRFTFDLSEWLVSTLHRNLYTMKECIQYSKKYCAPFSDRFKVRDLQFCTKGKVNRSQPFSVYFQIDGFNWWDILSPLFKYFTFKSMILMAAFEFCHADKHEKYTDKYTDKLEEPSKDVLKDQKQLLTPQVIAASYQLNGVILISFCICVLFLSCHLSNLTQLSQTPVSFPAISCPPAPDIVLPSSG